MRNRAAWLMLAESGLRPDTVTNIRWWWIREDFQAERMPMRINIPQQFVKDKVGDRWSFIGEDGFRALKEYLKPRLPFQDDDYVFVREPPKPRKKRPMQYTPISEHCEDTPERLPGIPFTSVRIYQPLLGTLLGLWAWILAYLENLERCVYTALKTGSETTVRLIMDIVSFGCAEAPKPILTT